MKPSPLQLKTYFLTELTVKAIPRQGDAPPEPSLETLSLSTQVHHAQNTTNPRDWRVILRLTCQPGVQGPCSYHVEMELLGFFAVVPAVPEERIKSLVMANAPALLYSAARELLLLVTGRAPHGPLLLPAVTFADEAQTPKPSEAPAPTSQRRTRTARKL